MPTIYVSKTGDDSNGGYPAAVVLADGGSVDAGTPTVITCATGWGTTAIGDLLLWGVGTYNERRRVTALAVGGDSTKIQVSAACTVGGGAFEVGGSLLTIDAAMNAVNALQSAPNSIAGPWTIEVGAGTYAETATIDVAGTTGAVNILKAASGATVVIDGESARANAVASGVAGSQYWRIEGIDATRTTDYAFSFASKNELLLVDCSAYSGAKGLVGGTGVHAYGLDLYSLTSTPLFVDGDCLFADLAIYGCTLVGNLGYGTYRTTFINSYIRAAAASQNLFRGGGNSSTYINCVADGAGYATTKGFYVATGAAACVNCIAVRCADGFYDTAVDQKFLAKNCCTYGNTAAYTNVANEGGVTSDPLFFGQDDTPPDYRLKISSPARAAGLNGFDIGCIQGTYTLPVFGGLVVR